MLRQPALPSASCATTFERSQLKKNWRRNRLFFCVSTTFGKLSLSLWSHTYKPNSKELQNETPWPLFLFFQVSQQSVFAHRKPAFKTFSANSKGKVWILRSKAISEMPILSPTKGNRDIPTDCFNSLEARSLPQRRVSLRICNRLSQYLQRQRPTGQLLMASNSQQDKNQSCRLSAFWSNLHLEASINDAGSATHFFVAGTQPVFPYPRPRYTNELHGHHRSSQYLRIQYSEYVSNHLGRHFKPSIVGLGFENNSALIYRWQGFPVVKLLMLALHMRHWSPEMMNSAVIHSAKLFFYVDPIQTYQYIISWSILFINIYTYNIVIVICIIYNINGYV